MSAYVKPIQPTPTLSGDDARKILSQVFAAPSQASIDRNKKMLEIRKKTVKK